MNTPHSSSTKKCPVCSTVLSSTFSHCPSCGVDVRPVTSYIHPVETGSFLFFKFLAYLCAILLAIFVFFKFLPGIVLLLFLTLLSIFFAQNEEKRFLNEYYEACKVETKRRSDIVDRMIRERREEELKKKIEKLRELEQLEIQKKQEEQRQSKLAEEISYHQRIQKEQETKRDELIRIHAEERKQRIQSIEKIHSSLVRADILHEPSASLPRPTNNSPVPSSFHKSTPLSALTDFVAIDTETTGFQPPPSGDDGIAQIAAIRFVDFRPVSIFLTKTNPGKPMPSAASKVNGLYDYMLSDAPAAHSVMESFVKFLGESPVIGFNLHFDLRFLCAYGFVDPFKERLYFDVSDIGKKVEGVSGKLKNIGEDAGFYCHYHREGYDSLAIGFLFDRYLRILNEPSPEQYPFLYEWPLVSSDSQS